MTERRCNECTLCCKLVPVAQIGKPANTRCKAQRAKGCMLYDKPGFPSSCKTWSCIWLINVDADDLPRPDRAHYVIDPMPDFIEVDGLTENGEPHRLPLRVVQIWCDPAFPNAHRDPHLRAWLERNAQETNQMALIRYGNDRAMVLCPPCMSTNGEWHEKESNLRKVAQHDIGDVLKVYEATQ